MANKFDQIAEKKKQAALAKQDEDVERFAKKVAGEVLGGIGDLSLKESVAALATTVAQAVVVSNEQIDLSLKDNFSRLLSAVKDNKPDDSSQVELSMKIGESLANLEKKFDDSKLSPEINLTAITQEELRTELSALLARLPQDSQRIVTVAYENASADKYLNVRLTDGIKFYKAGGASVVAGGGGTSGGLTDAELRASPVPVSATIDTTGLATDTGQTTGNASLSSIDGKITAVNTGAVTVASSALPSGASTSAKQDTLLAELQLKADLTETQPVSLASVPTHAVTQSGTWTEANSAAIKTAVETLDNAIAGSEMQVDVVGALPAGTNAIGKLAANSGVDIGDVDVTSLPVAFNAGTLSATTQRVVGATGSTSTQTQVADSASSQTILAANTARIRATIVNDSTSILYLRESSSAATTAIYTYKMYPDETVIIDDYNGALTGIWSTNASGSAVVSEVTA